MRNFIRKIDLAAIVKIEVFLFICVCLSGIIHIHFFNSYFNIFFFEFLNEDIFSDFKSVLTYSALENPYDRPYDTGKYAAPANYLPFAYLLLRPLAFLDFNVAYIIFNILLIFLFFFTLCKLKKSLKLDNYELKLLSFFIVFSHPFLFAFFRGNLDIFVGVLLLNIINFQKNDSFIPGLLIGIAGAIKLVPLAFCIYLLAIKNYKSILSCVASFLALTLFSINFYDLSLPLFLNYFFIEYADYKNIYVIGTGAMSFFSDPWLLISGFFKFLNHSEILIEEYYKVYNFVQILLMTFLSICIFIYRKNLSSLFVILLIGVMIIGFPAPSNDYKILYLLPGVVLYLSNYKKQHCFLATHILGISSTLLFLHFSFFYLVGPINVSSFVRPILYLISIISITQIFLINLINRNKIANM